MGFPRWWQRRLQSKASGAPARRRRPCLEPLEDRTLLSAQLLFNALTGELAIRGDAADHTIRQTFTPAGFLDVTVGGQHRSSDPASAFFDQSLAGATDATLAGIRFDGGGQETLILGPQALLGNLTVRAAGAAVVTEDVAAAGALTIQAQSITVDGTLRGSAIALVGSGWVTIDAHGVLTASARTLPSFLEKEGRGGWIEVTADVFVNTGQLQADGETGGQIFVSARSVLNAGQVTADGATSDGGRVQVEFADSYVATTAAMTSAHGGTGHGGSLTIDGGGTGRLFSSGSQQATGSVGGTIDLFGRDVVLVGAMVDVSGEFGGGSIRIGGDFQGRNPAIVNAQTVTITEATGIRADARQRGDGGRVIVWSDQDTQFEGSTSARGGLEGGAGGFIETSGKGSLTYGGTADAGAAAGAAGTLLLDPKNLIISAAPVGIFPQFNLIDPHPTAGGGFGTGITVLSNGNVVVTNPNDNFGGSRAGAVYLFDGLSGALLSSLVGSNPNDQVGSGAFRVASVTRLSNGNYLIASPSWNGNRGAMTWASGTSGVSGVVSAANSLVGSNPNDRVGFVTPLSNGNYLVTSPNWNSGAAAVTWGNGTSGVSGAVSSTNSLVGSIPGDNVGSGGIALLSNGNYVVRSFVWNNFRGAVTWGSGTTGVRGAVSDANSLVGANPGDQVGSSGITLLSNGNYIVRSQNWSGRGAVTWGSGTAGISGVLSAANSLVGSNLSDNVGLAGIALSNGNYVIISSGWNGGRGAVTWGNGSAPITGIVSAANSLVGSDPGDQVGDFGNVIILSNGNYVVGSRSWNGRRGAATWGDSTTGVTGTVSAANSLVGSSPNDAVGRVGALTNGNFVVASPSWNQGRGAATWGNGTSGIHGVVSDANSLVGSTPGDQVAFQINPLNNGNYVVGSSTWNSGAGAMTWGNGNTGVSGTVSAANSLVGSNPDDRVGFGGITLLSNGNYVVQSPNWNGNRGAVTWGNSTASISGEVTEFNSLVGSDPNDRVGFDRITPLPNGNYLISSRAWHGSRGAVTFASGTEGISGVVSADNSLVGANPGDLVGYGRNGGITVLSNGNYVVRSPDWNNSRGAATWGSSTSGVSGVVSADNSLVGSNPNDAVSGGSSGGVAALENGNFVVLSPDWNKQAGAATWGDGTTGVSGPVSTTNSLVGANPADGVGGWITLLRDGNYVITSSGWNGGRGAVTWGSGTSGVMGLVSESNSLVGSAPADFLGSGGVTVLTSRDYVVLSPNWNGRRGAVTWGNGASGQTLDGSVTITTQNSLVGRAANAGLGNVVLDSIHQSFLAPFVTEGGGRVTVGFDDPSQLSYARGQAQTVTITPEFLTRTLNTGTAVVLQASNDITVDDPIVVNADGNGGDLTLRAGRSILLNASITTDNGSLTLIANDTLASGVVDAQRDPGNAVITMAGGTVLDTGAGPLTIELRDGAGRTNVSSRSINLQTVTAGSVTVVNNGPSAGSDVRLSLVTSAGPQSYSNPHGVTIVAADLTTGGFSITFTDSVVINDAVSVGAGATTVDFAGNGTQTLQSGDGATINNLNHNGSGTLKMLSGLAVTGTLIQAAGTFDANDQPVTAEGAALVTGGTYLAGTAPQTFTGGLVLTDGLFTSSTGAMSISGGVTLTGGRFAGEGTVDALTVFRGTVAPGTTAPGVLTVAGAVAFTPLTTFSVLINGNDPGLGYSQLQAGGPIDLGGSTLKLVLGFAPEVGSTFTLLTSDAGPISGTFAGLDEGAIFTQDGFQFQITYQGGPNGNSVVLTRVA
jgi:hypothetical protein